MTEPTIIIDRKREKKVQLRAGDHSLQTLGLTDKDGELTRHGLTVLTSKVDPIPAWLGFEVYSWPASIIDRHRAGGPLEKRRLETIDTIEILAGEAVAALGGHLGPAISDLIRIVVTEPLANAATHRDYDIEEPIRVNQFPDAMAVWSPGLPVYSTLSSGSFEGRGTRNPELHFVMSALGYGQCQ
jgi:predicted HTH transcriptional regulator